MLLTETFSYQIGTIKTTNGYNMRVAYIDAKRSQDTYSIRKKIQEFGAKWNNQFKWWYWVLGNNPEQVIRQQVQPCIEYLSKIEDMGGEPKRNVVQTIDKLIAKVKDAKVPSVTDESAKTDILAKLEDFKRELINITSGEEFKRMMEPIIKFKSASQNQYSLLNTILILVQDPDATLVKSRKNWRSMNKMVVKNAKPIMLWYPIGERAYTDEERKELTTTFLRRKKVNSVKELTPGDREVLNKKLNSTVAETFDMGPYWFDIRFTEQIPGTEDVVGSPNANLPWYEADGKETPYIASKFDALLSVIDDYGIRLEFKPDLGGARGRSSNGLIELLSNQPKDAGMLNTAIHEFAHEILHQTYLKSNNDEMREYFVGREEGRAKVEQQAELCAWIVMRGFGFDMTTNINYVGIWGLNQDNAAKVFDSVSKTATLITKKIIKKEQGVSDMFESKQYIKENEIPNGYEIAKMVGCGNVYKKAALKQKNKQNKITEKQVIRLTERELNKLIKESVNNILTEYIKGKGWK